MAQELARVGAAAHRRGMGAPFTVAGNRLALVTEGSARLDALVALIDGAQHDLRLLYYIYADDPAGHRVHEALLAAAARGVRVALIVDGFGSGTTGDDAFFGRLRAGGIDLCVFHPRWGRRFLLRNHQKLALADGARAMIGGFNIAADYFRDDAGGWRDLGLSIEGPLAEGLADYFDTLHAWTRRRRASMRQLRRSLRRWNNPQGPVQWLLGGPARRLSPLAKTLRDDLARARRLAMITAYFAPNPAMLRRIDRLGLRGEARIVTAAKSDNTTTIGAARWTYAGLIRKRVRIFEYQPMRLHTKLVVLDDRVYIGSANFDMRSLYLNMEIMLRIEDAAFAAHVMHYVEGEIAVAREFTRADVAGWWRFPVKLRWAISYFLVAVLDYSVARRLNLDA